MVQCDFVISLYIPNDIILQHGKVLGTMRYLDPGRAGLRVAEHAGHATHTWHTKDTGQITKYVYMCIMHIYT